MSVSIAFSGGIAVGKTTLVTRLAKLFLPSQVLTEDPTVCPFWKEFYQSKARWAFHSRIGMLKIFLDRDEPNPKFSLIFMDRFVHELPVFAKAQLRLKNMTKEEYDLYMFVYERICKEVRWPDVVVRVRCNAEEASNRLRRRARDAEEKIDGEYLALVENLYDEWEKSVSAQAYVAELDNTSEIADASLVGKIRDIMRALDREPINPF